MLSARSFAIASRLALVTALTMFLLIIVGSIVRTTGSGLACPDWPLCQGQLIPPFQFNVMIEWFHRLLALVVSLMLAATVIWTLARRSLRSSLGGLAVLAVLLLAAQVMLGALTVWKLLHPAIVGSHLAVALLLFTTVLILALAAEHGSQRESGGWAGEVPPRAPGLLLWFALAAALTWMQAVLGGAVSTTHAATVCSGWPGCNGRWFPPMEGLIGIHMSHRYGAYALIAVMIVVFVRSRRAHDPAVRDAASLLLSLTLGQAVLGVCNVFLGAPVWLSAVHLGMAASILAIAVAATYRVASIPPASAAPALAGQAMRSAPETGGGV